MHFWLVAAIALLCTAPAQASLYTYTPKTITDRGDQGLKIGDLAFMLDISDAVVATGSFNYAYSSRSTGPLQQGDVADFQNFVIPAFLISVQRPFIGSYRLNISLRLDITGPLLSGFIYYEDNEHTFNVSGDSRNFDGTFTLGSSGPVNDVSGSVFSQVAIPEPSTLGLLGVITSIAALARLVSRIARAGWNGTLQHYSSRIA